MEKFDSNNILIEIISGLVSRNISFIIAGGVAVVLQGVERLTMDLDIAVSLEDKNIRNFVLAMDEMGFIPRLPIPASSLIDPDKRKIMFNERNALVFTFIDPKFPLRQVDCFLSPGLSFEELKDSVELIEVDGDEVQILNKEKLVQLKLAVSPMRDKDMFDIKELQRLINDEKK